MAIIQSIDNRHNPESSAVDFAAKCNLYFYCNGENGWVGQQLYQCRCFVTFQNMNQDRLAGKYVINLLKAALAQFSTAGSLQNLYGYKK